VVSGYFTVTVLVLALVTFGGVAVLRALRRGQVNAVAVLSSPAPARSVWPRPPHHGGHGRGAQRGILIKGGEALEMAHKIAPFVLG